MVLLKKKINREKIEEISTSNCEYYTLLDNMYKETECQLDYTQGENCLAIDEMYDVHKFLKRSGTPVMHLNHYSNKSMYFKLYGKYKTMFTKLNNERVSAENLYGTYISVINSMWYYVSNKDYPQNLRNYYDTIEQDVLNSLSEIIAFLTETETDKKKFSELKEELHELFRVIERIPSSFVHGSLTLDNVLVYHDNFKIINYDRSFIGPFLYDLVILVTDMCHKFGDDFEMVFVKDFYETSGKFFGDDVKDDDFFISYKTVQMFYLIMKAVKIIQNDTIDKKFIKYELRTEIENMMKYTIKYSEFRGFWEKYNSIMER